MTHTIWGLLLSLAALLCFTGSDAAAQSISLDDNPMLMGGFGKGAEDEFGFAAAPALTPSPSLGALGAPIDGNVFTPGIPAILEHTPNGGYIDAFSTNKPIPLALPGGPVPAITLQFSVDRLTTGLPGSAVLTESGFVQQMGDIYTSTATFPHPVIFAGMPHPAIPFLGPLPSAGVGGSNTLLIDESAFGLTTAVGIVPPGVFAGPLGTGSHDNVDAFDFRSLVPDPLPLFPGAGVYPVHSYFSIAPDEAVAVGASAADIFDTAAFASGTAPTPFATSLSMGLDSLGLNTDSIDALVMFDSGLVGGPENGGPGGEPGRDFALFSLAPGSASLGTAVGAAPKSASDVFFTDFTGSFSVFAFPGDLGLPAGLPGFPFQNQSNIDALEITVPEPTCGLLLLGMASIGWYGRRR
ncbi:hypothetical protein [Bythopirellula polymerisocia]|uniref:Ice-binding protein C-terminal domain-containing protein n=1 Tax=Bythopirellula polymerisocia TaxID=2528003 RepID=A0A5C6D0G9_9BACT|nr:hypothetical protein [Bythopirellula polymerisocia]TWU29655.1 hypothetical protein Pla144_04340 [Bythopirellula polymerisocia]